MPKKINYSELIKETLILTVAVAVIAAAVFFFLVPSHASVSSISGLGIVLSNFIPLQLSAITMILNVVLLIIGFLTCGKEFGIKTVYTSIMLPLFLGLFEILFPDNTSMTGSQELDVLCYILVVSIGLSILFNRNASSGGLDIVAKILEKQCHFPECALRCQPHLSMIKRLSFSVFWELILTESFWIILFLIITSSAVSALSQKKKRNSACLF